MIRCPRCKSTKIYRVAGGFGGNYYRCKKCGYAGALVIEYEEDAIPEEERGVQEEYQKEMQEYDERRRPLLWAVILLLLIALVFFILYR